MTAHFISTQTLDSLYTTFNLVLTSLKILAARAKPYSVPRVYLTLGTNRFCQAQQTSVNSCRHPGIYSRPRFYSLHLNLETSNHLIVVKFNVCDRQKLFMFKVLELFLLLLFSDLHERFTIFEIFLYCYKFIKIQ